MRILLIDNFDSFVYNVSQYFGELGCIVETIRNNARDIGQITQGSHDAMVISPGPGNPTNPKDVGVCTDVIKTAGKEKPVLGICLGHQSIAHAFGGEIVRATPMHGKTSTIEHDGKLLFKGVKKKPSVMRYHSLVVAETTFPRCLEINARSTDDKAIMALRHRKFPVFGVQFHPESIMTLEGRQVLENFCRIAKQRR
jgi:anthranilate synthase/aminodeoxychorismate synthase-like glutamine amidotransferase